MSSKQIVHICFHDKLVIQIQLRHQISDNGMCQGPYRHIYNIFDVDQCIIFYMDLCIYGIFSQRYFVYTHLRWNLQQIHLDPV